jgi:intraflagellar transport protein 81
MDDVRQDLQLMETEREQLTRRIDKIKRRVDAINDHESWLVLAAQRRALDEKEETLQVQKQEQRTAVDLCRE